MSPVLITSHNVVSIKYKTCLLQTVEGHKLPKCLIASSFAP